MRIRLSSSLLALTLAALVAAAGSGCQRELAVRGDPRIEGVIPHNLPEPDPNILGDPRNPKPAPGRTVSTPTPATTRAAATGTGTAPETNPETNPAPGPEPAGPADTEAYPIKLERPATAGLTYDTVITAEQTTNASVTVPGAAEPQVQEQTMKVELSGRMAISAVDDKGDPKEFALTITKFDLNGKEALAAAKIINAKRDAKEFTFTLASGEALADPVKEALKFAYDSTTGGDDDATFGSKTPRKVGENWPIDGEAAAKDVAKDGAVTVDPKNLTGQCTLKAVETVAGAKALRIEGTMSAKDIKPTDPATTVDSSELQAQFGGLFPIDAAQPPLEISEAMDLTMHMSAPAKVDMKMHMGKKETITPVK